MFLGCSKTIFRKSQSLQDFGKPKPAVAPVWDQRVGSSNLSTPTILKQNISFPA